MKRTVKPVVETKTTKTRKKVNPVYTVDITNAYDEYDVKLAFANAKLDAGIKLTAEEDQMIADETFDDFVEMMFNGHNGLIVLSGKRVVRLDFNIVETSDNSFIITGIHRNAPNPSLLTSAVENETVEIEKPSFLKRFWNWICGK